MPSLLRVSVTTSHAGREGREEKERGKEDSNRSESPPVSSPSPSPSMLHPPPRMHTPPEGVYSVPLIVCSTPLIARSLASTLSIARHPSPALAACSSQGPPHCLAPPISLSLPAQESFPLPIHPSRGRERENQPRSLYSIENSPPPLSPPYSPLSRVPRLIHSVSPIWLSIEI